MLNAISSPPADVCRTDFGTFRRYLNSLTSIEWAEAPAVPAPLSLPQYIFNIWSWLEESLSSGAAQICAEKPHSTLSSIASMRRSSTAFRRLTKSDSELRDATASARRKFQEYTPTLESAREKMLQRARGRHQQAQEVLAGRG